MRCAAKIKHPDDEKIGKVRSRSCGKKAPDHSLFDGRETLSLCPDHAKDYTALGLTVRYNGDQG